MSKFKARDKVRCVNARNTKFLVEGRIYTIEVVDPLSVKVDGYYYDPSRFEPVADEPVNKAPPPRPELIRRKMWANVYDDEALCLCDTPASAGANAEPGVIRIAVPVMVTEIEEGGQ